jgi:sporulation protein YlmC with PRC-barrel domain
MHARGGLFSSQSASCTSLRLPERAVLPLCRAFSEPIVAAAGEAPRRPPTRQQQPRTAPPPSRQYAGTAPAPSAPVPGPVLRREPPSSDDVYLPRSLIMDKEVITRTSGKRLGYVNQLFVDPARLEVVSVYLRQGITSIAASNTDHVLISSLRQIGDVVLVHDESALLDPPADETYGYIRMVGTEVQTEDGTSLGKVRDFIFNPDNGQIVSIRYDALGLPSIPQSLLSCYTLGWQDIVAVGPTKTIVRYGAERRAVKENDGWISEYVSALVNAVAGAEEEGRLENGGGFGVGGSEEAYRGDPAYAAWYQLHAAEYEKYYGQRLPKPITAEMRSQQQPPPPRQRAGGPPPQQQQQGRRRAEGPPRQPMALPPPSSTSYTQALQPDQQQWRQEEYETVGGMPPPRQQQQQQQRQYVGGGGSGGGGAPIRRTTTRQPPPFAPRQDMPPQQQQQRGPAARPPLPRRPATAARPEGPPPQTRNSAAVPTQQSRGGAVEPDAVIITPPPPQQQ